MGTSRWREVGNSIGLLLLRVGAGTLMALGHGLTKFQAYSVASASFPDPLGVGSSISMALAISAELFCSLLVVIGLGTRLAAIPVAFTMVVAAFVIHAGDPTFAFQAKALGGGASKEMALIFLVPFLALIFTGPGEYSLDHLIQSRRAAREPARSP